MTANSTKTFDLLQQAALVGRATAVDMFVNTLNPKNRSRKFKWDRLADKAGLQAVERAKDLVPVGSLPWWRKAIIHTASDEAYDQMREMIETSQVNKWCRKNHDR